MNKVAIVSSGMTRFAQTTETLESIMLSSIQDLFAHTPNLEQKDIEVMLTSTNAKHNYLANILSEMSGCTPKISHTVECLCNSGTNSLISAWSYISSGLVDTALVVGGEKTDNPGLVLKWDASRGEFQHPIFWASMFTSAYMRKFGTALEDISYVSVKNHRNAMDNPFAYFQKPITVDDVMQSKSLTDNLRLFDCSISCDGAASILLCSEDKVKNYTDKPIWITGIGQKTTSASFTKTEDFSSMKSTHVAANDAYSMSKKTPDQIDVAEIHDAFSICELIELEELQFCKKGNSSRLVRDLYDTRDRKINPRGGLLGAGHPLGATGVAQTVEIHQQLTGSAGKRQVDNAQTGLVHNMSAGSTSSTVLILES